MGTDKWLNLATDVLAHRALYNITDPVLAVGPEPDATASGAERTAHPEQPSSDAAGLAVRRVLTTHGAAAVWHFVGQATADPALRRRLHDALASSPRQARRTA